MRNTTRGSLLAARADLTTELLRRALGLIGRRDWSAADGLVLDPCNSVHTFFMRVAIDVVYVNSDGRVLRTVHALRPWRIGPIVFGSRWVLELPMGTISRTGTLAGDRLDRSASEVTAGLG